MVSEEETTRWGQSHHQDETSDYQSLHQDDSHPDKTAFKTQTTQKSRIPETRAPPYTRTEGTGMMDKDPERTPRPKTMPERTPETRTTRNHLKQQPLKLQSGTIGIRTTETRTTTNTSAGPKPRAVVSNFSVTISSGTLPDAKTLAKVVTERS